MGKNEHHFVNCSNFVQLLNMEIQKIGENYQFNTRSTK